jgi:DNA-directed RNA polymerase subunit M
MMFCPRCGKLLIRNGRSERFSCPKCGYKTKMHNNLMQKQFNVGKTSVVSILDKGALSLITSPTVNVFCKKCGHSKAETWNVPVGSRDISSITFYKCVYCGHTWRETE